MPTGFSFLNHIMAWLNIDVNEVLRERLPRYHRVIPRPLISWLERQICQKELNLLLEHADGLEGADFCRDVLNYLHVDYKTFNAGQLPPPADTRVTYVCNHPLGGLDGLALIDMVTRHHGCEPYFVVNDLLMAVEPLRKVFIPVNKHGRQTRKGSEDVEAAFKSDRPVIVFPAGLVSRRQKDGSIADLKWRKSFIPLSIESKRDIVPLFFDGTNSSFFYKLAQRRVKLGIKFNFEMVRLPRELVMSRNKQFGIYVGKRIDINQLKGGSKANIECEAIRRIVYNLKPSAD